MLYCRQDVRGRTISPQPRIKAEAKMVRVFAVKVFLKDCIPIENCCDEKWEGGTRLAMRLIRSGRVCSSVQSLSAEIGWIEYIQ